MQKAFISQISWEEFLKLLCQLVSALEFLSTVLLSLLLSQIARFIHETKNVCHYHKGNVYFDVYPCSYSYDAL